jgi:hypothetical protein
MIRKIVVATSVLVLAAMTAGAASAHICYARGGTGATGWGRSPYLGTARSIALAECAVRTPRGYMCYITGCR